MVIFYDKNGRRIGKAYEVGWNFSQKRNKEGTGKIELVDYPLGAKYASLYKGKEKIKDVVITENSSNNKRVSTSIRTLESLFKNYRLPENWKGWNKKPLNFVLSDAVNGFDYIQKSTIEDFSHYLEKTNVALNKIKDGDIHLDYYQDGDSLKYYEKGTITFAFDCGDIAGQRYVRWVETTGEKVYIGIQSVSSDTPISSISQVDFSGVPILNARRDIENDSSFSGVPIASMGRYVAVRFVLKYINPDWISDFATHKVYNENNVLVDRTVRGFTPVIRAFEIITRKKSEFKIKSAPMDMGELIEDIELSNITIWEAIQKIREKYKFDTDCYIEKGKIYFEFAKSLVKNKTRKAKYFLRASDKQTSSLNNTNIKELKQEIQKVNVLHCYGEGERQQKIYVRIPEVGTFDNLPTVEETFSDSKIKTRKDLKTAGEKALKEKRKEDNPIFEVETIIPIRLFDKISLIHPDTEKVYECIVEEENISYKGNVFTQKFGIGGALFNPLSALIPKNDNNHENKILKPPVGLTATSKIKSISLEWEGDDVDFVVRWKEKGQIAYNYRHSKQTKILFERLKPNSEYLFSIASVYEGRISDYTAEISCIAIAESAFSFPTDTNILSLLNFDEKAQALPAPNPSYTAWKSKIIELDCTDKQEIKMTFEDALNNVIILSGELKNDFTLKLFFDKQNGNGAKQYLIVYKLTGIFNVTIQTEEPATNKISQNINAKTFGLGCYAVIDFRGNVWAFEGNIKQSLIDEILQHTENKLNNNAQQTITNFKNEINNFYLQEKNKMNMFIQEKMNEIKNYHKDRFIKNSGAIGEIRYFTSKKYTYGYLYANGFSFIPELYPEFYQFWLENFGDKKKKNYLGYDSFGYPKLPDLRGVALRAVDDGSGRGGAELALEYQGDGIRNIKGGFSSAVGGVSPEHGRLFYTINEFEANHGHTGDSNAEYATFLMDASRVVPTAEDNRVKSYGVYPFIKVI